ncbi:DUF1876 domain-containing protein [Streptacidiphilus sp. EB129]|uniref:DUF1876 domain-containing protein n=1 Tax=Streptacidiphilus sp. EB129 TaxID=3156262 RepID=UPI0035184A88
MHTVVGWHIEMEFQELEHKTAAAAMLRLADGTELRAHGYTSRHPSDADQPRVGEELAAARALNDLASQLFSKARGEIDQESHLRTYPMM